MNKNQIMYQSLANEELIIDNKIFNFLNILTDSKKIQKNDLFVAIRGGNNYIKEALEKGAFVVADKKRDIENERLIYVEDSIAFLQKFAALWRKNINTKIIAITGSNGKTTVKDMLHQLLSTTYKGKKTQGNYNNHIGLPLTLLNVNEEDEFAVLEMGMSDFGEIDLLAEISKPEIGIITNIGDSHLEFLKSRENVFKAKAELIPHLKNFLITSDDDKYLSKIENNYIFDKNKTLEHFKIINGDNSENNHNILYYDNIKYNENGTRFDLIINNEKISIESNIIGEHNVMNLVLAIACALKLDVKLDSIVESVKHIELTDMRFQKLEIGETTYINDAYNASPLSVEKSLVTFSNIYNNGIKKIIALSDMLELGEEEEKFHKDLFKILKETKFDLLLLYGPRMKYLYDDMKLDNIYNEKVIHFEDKKKLKEYIKNIKEKKVVLLKGSRGTKLEEIIERGSY